MLPVPTHLPQLQLVIHLRQVFHLLIAPVVLFWLQTHKPSFTTHTPPPACPCQAHRASAGLHRPVSCSVKERSAGWPRPAVPCVGPLDQGGHEERGALPAAVQELGAVESTGEGGS